jgi:hypothetical protein
VRCIQLVEPRSEASHPLPTIEFLDDGTLREG